MRGSRTAGGNRGPAHLRGRGPARVTREKGEEPDMQHGGGRRDCEEADVEPGRPVGRAQRTGSERTAGEGGAGRQETVPSA